MALTSSQITAAYIACVEYAATYPGTVSSTAGVPDLLAALSAADEAAVSALLTRYATLDATVVASSPSASITEISGNGSSIKWGDSRTAVSVEQRDNIAAAILQLLGLLETTSGFGAASDDEPGWP